MRDCLRSDSIERRVNLQDSVQIKLITAGALLYGEREL